VSGGDLTSSIISNSAGVFRFDTEYNLDPDTVGLRRNATITCMNELNDNDGIGDDDDVDDVIENLLRVDDNSKSDNTTVITHLRSANLSQVAILSFV